MQARRRQSGASSAWMLLALVVAIAGAGAWNYHRNVSAEARAFRPYRGLGDAELAQLADAYRSEAKQLDQRYQAARTHRSSAQDRGLLGEQVDEFERVQRASAGIRKIGAALSEREAALRDLEAEQKQRELERNRLATFLRRLLTLG
jgi:hypothetical protein